MKLFLSSLVILACACSGYSGFEDSDGVSDFGADGSNAASGDSSGTLDERDLMGTWLQSCESLDPNVFERTTATFQDDALTLTEDHFAGDATCSTASSFTSSARFTFEVPNYIPSAQNQIDLTVERVFLRFNTPAAVTVANQTAVCGFTDWQVAAQKDVTGNPCSQLPNAGQLIFQIFQIRAPNLLFIGRIDPGTPGTTPETRPTTLEALPFSRP